MLSVLDGNSNGEDAIIQKGWVTLSPCSSAWHLRK